MVSISNRHEFGGHENMRGFISAWPSGGNAVDHVPDMAVRLDQVGQIFRWQIEARLAREQNDFVVGHVETPGFSMAARSGLSTQEAKPVPAAASNPNPRGFNALD
jgi:hypothetical protein